MEGRANRGRAGSADARRSLPEPVKRLEIETANRGLHLTISPSHQTHTASLLKGPGVWICGRPREPVSHRIVSVFARPEAKGFEVTGGPAPPIRDVIGVIARADHRHFFPSLGTARGVGDWELLIRSCWAVRGAGLLPIGPPRGKRGEEGRYDQRPCSKEVDNDALMGMPRTKNEA